MQFALWLSAGCIDKYSRKVKYCSVAKQKIALCLAGPILSYYWRKKAFLFAHIAMRICVSMEYNRELKLEYAGFTIAIVIIKALLYRYGI